MKTTGLKKGTAVRSANDATLEDGNVATGDKSVAASWELVPDSEFEAPSGLKEMTLEVLAKNINGRLDKIETAVSSARKYAETALLAAMETGHYLNESRRKCEKGKWGTWREQNCPGLSKATAHRYMDLADNVSHVRHDKSIRTLRQAYIAVGLVSEPSSPKPRDLTDRR